MSKEINHSLDVIQNWKRKLCDVSASMAAHGEIILHEHTESIIAELDFQMSEILTGGPIVQFRK